MYGFGKLTDDRAYVLSKVQKNGGNLRYASAELRNDREVVLAAVRNRGYALGYASKELRGDREIVLEAAKRYGWLGDASLELIKEPEVVAAFTAAAGITFG